jgi:hypothetical protein
MLIKTENHFEHCVGICANHTNRLEKYPLSTLQEIAINKGGTFLFQKHGDDWIPVSKNKSHGYVIPKVDQLLQRLESKKLVKESASCDLTNFLRVQRRMGSCQKKNGSKTNTK